MIERMDHAVVAVASTADAAATYERLGLRVTQPARHPGLGSESRAFFAGQDARQSFYVELFGIVDKFAFAGTPADAATRAEAVLKAGASRVEFGTPHGLTARQGLRLLGERVLPRVGSK